MRKLKAFIAGRSLRFLMSAAALCVTAPLLVLTVYLGQEQLQAGRQEVFDRSMGLARLFALKYDNDLRHARTLLETLAATPSLAFQEPDNVHKLFQRIIAANSQYAYLTLAGPDGHLWASSSSSDTSIDLNDLEQFQVALREDRFNVGQPIVSRTTGLPVLPFGLPVKDAGGRMSGVLLLGLKLTELDKYYSSLTIPEGGRLVLFNDQGTRLLRYPQRDISSVGPKIAVWDVIAANNSESGTFTSKDQTGTALTYAFVKLWPQGDRQGYLGVLVGIPTPDWGSRSWPIFGRILLAILGVTTVALVINGFLSDLIVISGVVRLSRAVSEVAGGRDPLPIQSVPGCRELQTLRHDFNAMVQALVENHKARDIAETRLRAESSRFAALLENATDGIHILDEDGRLIFFSPSFAAMLGYSAEEAAGLCVADWDAGFPKEELVPTIRALVRSGRTFETKYRRKDGTLLEVEITARGMELDGRFLLYASARDITARRQAEEVIRNLEKRYRELIENAPIGVFQSTPGGRFIATNQRLATMYGYDSAQDLIESITDIGAQLYVDPGERENIHKTLEYGNIDRMEVRRRRKDGAFIWVALSMRAVRDNNNVIIRYEGFSTDITKLKTAEEALRNERMRLAYVLEGTNLGTWEWNIQTGETVFNKRWAEIVGYTLEELAPVSIDTWASLAHPDDLKRSGEKLRKHFSGESPYYDCECRMRRKDGSWVWVHDRGRVFSKDSQGNPLTMFGSHQDITERKAFEEAVQESEERYRAFFTALDAIKLIIDPTDGTIFAANPAAEVFYGYNREQLTAMRIYDLNVLPKDEVLAELAKVPSGEQIHFFFRHRRADGDIRDVEVYAGEIRIRGNKLVISTIHDISEMRRLERIKEDVERIVRHDLKSPLNAAITIPFILMEEDNLTPDQRRLLSLMAAAGRRMLTQINSSLEMHKIESGTYQIKPQACDPILLIGNAIEIIGLSMDLAPERFSIRDHTILSGQSLAGFRTDPLLLDIVLLNLLRNAVEASGPDDTVGLDISIEGGSVLSVTISNAAAVPPELRDRFFEKYATAGKVGGTGLGTYSAAMMVRAMGGNIAMETSEAAGTTVTVRLPMSLSVDQATEAEQCS
ncbi:PAS domain S-box protein [Solidesulfovibrio magneticus]|uniref:histidine kinase n=1 Tax=Solidesulfovibrio magneticus (strain ATCC 700980 / DSM 13731 / RS-1) TaxID=573370 RepID=C4XGQ8_SOLM1|nr:PAS domain S-box protein [Solidesulfovibrio magneticus]BAH76216.1 sensor histidine kinase [Solidesulfovibrio magneticus RS-1]